MHLLCTFLFCIIFLHNSSPLIQRTQNSNHFSIHIERISNQVFPSCTLLYFTGKSEIDFHSTQILSEKPSLIHNFDRNDTRELNQRIFENVIKYPGSTQIVKRCDHCLLVISWDLSPSNFLSFTKILSGRNPIFFKDEHFFIFTINYNERNSLDSFLYSTTLSRIKYKMILAHEIHSSDVQIYTICFYCDKGNPLAIQLNSLDLGNPQILLRDYVSIGFFGKNLKLSYPLSTRFLLECEKDKQNNLKVHRGIHALLVDASIQWLNFTYEIFESTGGGTGLIQPNGTWIGTVSDVIYKRADIGLVTAEILDRHEVVTFSFPVTYEYLTFTYGPPSPVYKYHVLLWPLDISTWIATLLGFLLIALTFYIFVKNFSALSDEKEKWTFGFIILSLVSLISEQAYKMPNHRSLRILFGSFLALMIIVATAYRSKLVTFLLFPVVREPPKSFEALAEQTEYSWGLQYIGGAAYHLFKTATTDTYIKIYSKMDKEPEAVQCFNRSIVEHFCCIVWVRIIDYISSKNMSDRFGRKPLHIAPAVAFFLGAGWVMEKRAIYKKNFNEIIHWTVDTGISMKWEHLDHEFVKKKRLEWEKETNFVNPFTSRKSRNLALSLKHLYGAFVAFLFACLLWIMVFLVEICWKYNKKKPHKKIISELKVMPETVDDLTSTMINRLSNNIRQSTSF